MPAFFSQDQAQWMLCSVTIFATSVWKIVPVSSANNLTLYPFITHSTALFTPKSRLKPSPPLFLKPTLAADLLWLQS
jgi:hypothetical protein